MNAPVRHEEPLLRPNEKLTGGLVFGTVVVTTWAFAGRASWAPTVFTALSLGAALVSILTSLKECEGVNWWAWLPLGLFALLVGASLLNPAYTALEIPGRWIQREAWISWLPTTVDSRTTLQAMLPWLSALMLGGSLRQAAFGRRAVRLFWLALLIHGLLVAAVGAYFHLTGNEKVFGIYYDRYGYHFSSFIYRNHWAAYAMMLVALSLGFMFSAFRRWRAERQKLDSVLPGMVAALLIALTLPMPGSRSGMLVVGLMLVGAFTRLGWVLWHHRSVRSAGISSRLPGLILALFMMVILGIGGWLNREMLARHWDRTTSQMRSLSGGQTELRLRFSIDTVRMAWDRPVWGWGVGSFGIIFPKYQGDYLRDDNGKLTARVINAHNDWAETWAETGLVGLAILLLPLGILLRSISANRSSLMRWGGGGVVLILAYALVDFPLHNPAVLFLWISLLCTAAPAAVRQLDAD